MNNNNNKATLLKVDTERGLIFISTKKIELPPEYDLEKRINDVELEHLQFDIPDLFGEKPLNYEDMISMLVAKHGFMLVDVADWSYETFTDLSWQMMNYSTPSKNR